MAEGLNSPLTTSAGRLFDAVAAALGVCRIRTYEGQPAMELEMAADETDDGFYPAAVNQGPDALVLDTLAIFRAVVRDRNSGVAAARHRRPLPQLPGPAFGRRLRPDPGADRAQPGGPVRRRDAERPAVHPA